MPINRSAVNRVGVNGGASLRPAEESEDISSALATDSVVATAVNKVRESISVTSTARTFYSPTVSVLDTAFVGSALRSAARLALSSAVDVGSSVAATIVMQVAEVLRASSSAITAYHSVLEILEGILSSDHAYYADVQNVVSEVTVQGFSEEVIARVIELLDSVLVEATPEVKLTIVVRESSAILAEDSVELSARLLASLVDSVGIFALLKTPSEIAQGWAVNTEGAMPVSEYDNFNFNSLAEYKGVVYGTSDEGLYVMGADDDAGTPIAAELTSLFLDMGTSRMKRIRAAYLGYTSTGDLVMKVRSFACGQLTENWYKAKTAGTEAPHGGRMLVGQGMKSRYWQFELVNINGADFEIDQIELYPIMLNRRV